MEKSSANNTARRPWLPDELETVSKTLARPIKNVAKQLNRPTEHIAAMRAKIRFADAPLVRAYTDADVGYIEETMNRPLAEVARVLGRTLNAIAQKRVGIRRGLGYTRNLPWSDDEVELVARSPNLTAQQITNLLPGRTYESVRNFRRLSGMFADGRNRDPARVGGRPLIAKTCVSCGLLLPADWFAWSDKTNTWSAWCKKCKSDKKVRLDNPDTAKYRSDRFALMQKLSMPSAVNLGNEYTASDHAILSNPDLTAFEKSIRLGRSFAGTTGALHTFGYKSHRALGDPETDIWKILNPNMDQLEEITHRIEYRESNVPVPQW
jgi:hypothetical protein